MEKRNNTKEITETIELEIFRYNPEGEGDPTFSTYEIPFHEDWAVLDAINYIKNEVDGTLSYRWSCQMGVCGSCGIMINGVPKLSCAAFLKDYYPNNICVEPLSGFPVEKDLIIEMDDFITKLTDMQPYIIRKDGEEKPLDEGEYIQSPEELAHFKQYSMCINCMLCYAACPIYHITPTFIGPAAIALGQRYNMDSRDQGRDKRQELIASHDGIWECTFVGECSAVCPKDVDPAAAIQRAKVSSTIDWFKDVLIPWGKKK